MSNLSDIASADGRLLLVWREVLRGGRQQIHIRAAGEQDPSFAPAQNEILATLPETEFIYTLRVAAHGANVYVMYSSGSTEGIATVSFLRSIDGGMTFAPAVTLRDGSPYADLAVDEAGVVHVLLEDRGRTDDIHYMRSIDAGATFSEAVALAASEGRSLHPRVATRRSDIAAVWEEVNGGRTSVHFAHSNDGGQAFGAARPLSAPAKRSGSPAVAYGDEIHVVWIDDGALLYAKAAGDAFGAAVVIDPAGRGASARAPRVVATDAEVRVAWTVEEATGALRGPFVRHARHGAGFTNSFDLSRDMPGGAFGGAALAATRRGVAAWSYTPTRIAADSQIIVSNALPACTISWRLPANGLWTVPSNWARDGAVSTTIPGPTDDVCITVAGTYTVTKRNPTHTVNTLTIGNLEGRNDPVPTMQTMMLDAVGTNGSAWLVATNGIYNEGTFALDGPSATGLASSAVLVTNGVFENTANGILDIRNNGAVASGREIHADVLNHGLVRVGKNVSYWKHGGTFTNNATVTVLPGFTFTFPAIPATFLQEAGTLTVDGAFTMSGDRFEHNGGEITGTVTMGGNSTLKIGGGGAGRFNFLNASHTLIGDVGTAHTLLLTAVSPNGSCTLTSAEGFTNSGKIVLQAGGGTSRAQLVVTSGILTNNGEIHSAAGGIRDIGADILNTGTGTVKIDTVTDLNKAGGTFTNEGTVDVADGADLRLAGAGMTFTQKAGTIDLHTTGKLTTIADTFEHDGGSIAGTVVLTGNSTLDIGAGGAGRFNFLNASHTLNGNVGAAHTLLLTAVSPNGSCTLTSATGFTNFGKIVLQAGGGTSRAQLFVTDGILTNSGEIQSAAGGIRDIGADIHNTSTGLVNVDTLTDLVKTAGIFTNEGTVDVANGAALRFFAAGLVFNQNAGVVQLNTSGALTMNADTFNFNGGEVLAIDGSGQAMAGNSILASDNRLNIGPASIGRGMFTFRNSGNEVTGTIAPAQIVFLEGLAFNARSSVTAPNGLTNNGLLIFDATGPNSQSSNSGAILTVTTGALTNNGTTDIRVSVPGDSPRSIVGDVANHGTMIVRKNTTLSKSGGVFTNHNLIEIEAGVTLTVTNAPVGQVNTFLNPDPGRITGAGTLSLGQRSRFRGVGNIGTFITNGEVHPGASPGVLNVNGNMTCSSDCDIFIEIGGRMPAGPFDQINVTGTMTISTLAVLDVKLVDGACPEGDYPIFTYAARSADFGTKTGLTGLEGGRSFTTLPGATQYVLRTNGPLCNRAPVANNDSYNVNRSTGLTVPAPGVLGNDTDADNDPITAVLVAGPANGMLTLNGDGSFTYTPGPGCEGSDSFTYKANDAELDSNVATVTLTIIDDIAPSIVAPANITVSADASCGATVDPGTATASDNCDTDVTITITGVPANNRFLLGPTTITYTATDDAGNITTATQTVTVEDRQAPTLQAPPNITVGSDANSCSATVDLGQATATDNCDATVEITGAPASNVFPLGTTTITYTATDDAGNTTTATQAVTVEDHQAPTLQAPPDITVGTDANSCSATVDLGEAAAADNCDTNVEITRTPAGNVFPVGTTVITYTARDDAGNTSTAMQTVTVTDNTPPSVTAPADVNRVITAAASCAIVITDVELGSASASDNCGNATVTRTGAPAGNLFPLGITTITYTATDSSGRTSTATQTVTVLDGAAPVITDAAASPAEITPADGRMVDVTVSYGLVDACGGATAVLSATSSDPDTGEPDVEVVNVNLVRLRAGVAGGATERLYTITITATDAGGNSSSATVVVTVHDEADTPLSILQQVEKEADRLVRERAGRKGINHLEKALKDVRSAIDSVRSNQRGCAANAVKNAVQAIEQAVNHGALSQAEGLIHLRLLTQASRMLVVEAIELATAAGHRKVANAQTKLADGDAAANANDFRRAVQEYKTAIDTLEGGSCGN